MKGVFVILDGVGDEQCQQLGQKTPLEAAKTPNLDLISKKSRIDYCYTVKEGFVPASEQGVMSLLGYDYNEVPRGPLEALGIGLKLRNGDLSFRCNFATVDDLDSGHVLDRRAGRTLTIKESRILAEAINKYVMLPFKFQFFPTIQHRGVLVIRGGFSNNIGGIEKDSVSDKICFAKSLDEEDDSKLSVNLLNSFARQVYGILDKHTLNSVRARKGLYSANFLLCRGVGNEPAKLKKLRGKWMGLGYMPLEIGIARAAGMDTYGFRYPELKGIDVYENLWHGLKLAVKYTKKMIKRNSKKYDYFYVHIKETDIPGHDNKPFEKVKMIEYLDRELFSFLRKFLGNNKDAKLIVTADHATSCRRKAHTADPVPVLIYPSEDGDEKRFTESDAMKGKKILGKNLLEKYLFPNE